MQVMANAAPEDLAARIAADITEAGVPAVAEAALARLSDEQKTELLKKTVAASPAQVRTPTAPATDYDVTWQQVRAEVAGRLGCASLPDREEQEILLWQVRGFDPLLCLMTIRAHFDERGPTPLQELSTPLARAHHAARREYMGRLDALKLLSGRQVVLAGSSIGEAGPQPDTPMSMEIAGDTYAGAAENGGAAKAWRLRKRPSRGAAGQGADAEIVSAVNGACFAEMPPSTWVHVGPTKGGEG
jgi:hypothetical protein